MKKKLITVTSAALLAAALACPAWAEEMPVDRATPSKATVSAQVDTATNSKHCKWIPLALVRGKPLTP